MEDVLEYDGSILDYNKPGNIVDTYNITVRRRTSEDRIDALKETLKFIDLNL